MQLKTYTTSTKEVLLYTGNPNFELLEDLVKGSGDLWHSSLDQGFLNCFQDIIYQTAVFWYYLNDIEHQEKAINWRVNAQAFVIRETVWNQLSGLDMQFESEIVSGLDFGFSLLRYQAGIPLYIRGLFPSEENSIEISIKDRYTFFFKNFKNHHALYMLIRKGFWSFPSEYNGYKFAKKNAIKRVEKVISPRDLQPLKKKPTISLVIPTMKRQKFAQLVLEDHKNQTYLIKEAIIVDATPKEERDDQFYKNEDFPFEVKVKWQTSKGSCRARNEAIDLCTGDYIIFADDDIRILPDFVENHLRLLQTYNAAAANGLDIMAKNVSQDLSDLKKRLKELGENRWKVGVSGMFSNANSIVKREVVKELTGNDINFDGGYGEDSDFGFRILKKGYVLLHNPFSPNLHLKPPQGGYRWWGSEAKKKGKKRKQQPWELDNAVKNIRPVPSPTVTYGILKHFKENQIKEWKTKYFFLFLFKDKSQNIILKLIRLPYKLKQFSKSIFYAKSLINLGERYK